MSNENAAKREAHLIKLAESNIDKGVIEEPRVYTESFSLTDSYTEGRSNSLTFRNGEKFPVRVLYMTANVFSDSSELAAGTFGERLLQGMGLRMKFHDQYYMRPEYVRLPNWGTHPVASAEVVSPFTSAHKMERPVVLSVRDSFQVRVQAAVGPLTALAPSEDEPWRISATFTGVGIFSKRPYVLSSSKLVYDSTTTELAVADFQNDGGEPILITDFAVNANAVSAPSIPILQCVKYGVRQIGNGTNAEWVISEPGVDNLAYGPLWGTYSGRALVHRFPGHGLVWEPGEGIDINVLRDLAAAYSEDTTVLNVGLVGYLAVQ